MRHDTSEQIVGMFKITIWIKDVCYDVNQLLLLMSAFSEFFSSYRIETTCISIHCTPLEVIYLWKLGIYIYGSWLRSMS